MSGLDEKRAAPGPCVEAVAREVLDDMRRILANDQRDNSRDWFPYKASRLAT